MKIYWTLKSVPELASLTRKQRCRVHEQCLRRHFWYAGPTWRSVVGYSAFIFTVAGFVLAGESILRLFGVGHSFWTTVVCAFIGAVVGSFVISQIAISMLRPFYQEFIETCEKHAA